MRIAPTIFCGLALAVANPAFATDDAGALARALGEALVDGDSTARFKMRVRTDADPKGDTFQVTAKSRRTPDRTQVAYEILWPGDRKGEAVIVALRRGGRVQGAWRSASGEASPLGTDDAGVQRVFGSDLVCADLAENFFLWRNQEILRRAMEGGVECVVLESRPGPPDRSIYSKVVSWIDTARMLPMRVEKFDEAGRIAVRIDTTGVARESGAGYLPSALAVRRAGSPTTTEIDGASIRRDRTLTDADFSVTPD